jgi:hypothetical protein
MVRKPAAKRNAAPACRKVKDRLTENGNFSDRTATAIQDTAANSRLRV